MTPDRALAFIASLPRSGSTMLQLMLATHEEVSSTSEPWLMLPLIYATRSAGHQAEYDTTLAERAHEEMVRQIPGGEETYRRVLAESAREIYSHLRGSARLFIDKTPRYYLILDELAAMFPGAPIIVLTRDPIAVLSSILETWAGDDPAELRRYAVDLLRGPSLLLHATRDARFHVVAYERLVTAPEEELQSVSQVLGLIYDPSMVEYGHKAQERHCFGDQGTVYRRQRPDPSRLDWWREASWSPQRWRWLSDYLDLAGREVVSRLGCDVERSEAILKHHRPPLWQRRRTIPLAEALRLRS